MLVDIKYAEHDIVKFKYGHVIKSSCPCDFCGSTGRIRGMDGTEEECPRCDGTGAMELRHYEVTEEENGIRKIGVKWDRQSKPQVYYIMGDWKWSQTEIPQDDIVRKIGEYRLVDGQYRKELTSKE